MEPTKILYRERRISAVYKSKTEIVRKMNKYKKLAFNTLIFGIGSFGSKILVILLTRLYTKEIDPGNMGIKSNLETIALLLQPIFTFALQEYLIRFGIDKKYDKRAVFTTSAAMTLIGMAAVILIVPGLRFISVFSFISGYSMMLAVYICTSSLRMLCAQFVRARDMVKLFSLDGILATLTLFIFNVIFISELKMGIKGFFLSVILSDILSAVFLFLTAGLKKFLGRKYFSVKLVFEMLRFSLPLVPTIVMWTVTSLSDRIFLSNMRSSRVELGDSATGLYDVANKIPNLISMVSTIFFQAWNISAIAENDSADRSSFYEKVYSTYEAILFIAASGLMLLTKPITSFLANSDNYEAYSAVYLYTPVLIIAAVFTALNQFLGGIYSATKHTKNSFWTCLAACTANLILNYVMIPVIGIQGAATATLLSYYLCFWARIIDARYYVPFKFSGARSLTNTGLLVLMSIIVIKAPPLWGVWLFLIFAAVTIMNFKPMMATVRKIVSRKR